MKLNYLNSNAYAVGMNGYHELQDRSVALSVILPTGTSQSGRG